MTFTEQANANAKMQAAGVTVEPAPDGCGFVAKGVPGASHIWGYDEVSTWAMAWGHFVVHGGASDR